MAESVAFVRSNDEFLFPASSFAESAIPEDTTSGETSPDLEFFFTPISYRNHAASKPPNVGQYGFMTHAVLLRCDTKASLVNALFTHIL